MEMVHTRDSPSTINYAPEGVASIKIFDVSGRLVGSFSLATDYCLPNTLIWDGSDAPGRKLPGGVYFVRLEAGNFNQITLPN